MHPAVGFLPLQNRTIQEVGVQVMLVTITAKSVTPNLSATLIRLQRHFTPEGQNRFFELGPFSTSKFWSGQFGYPSVIPACDC